MTVQLMDLMPGLREEGVTIRYRALYEMARDGDLPGCRRINGRWYIDATVAEVVDAVRAA